MSGPRVPAAIRLMPRRAVSRLLGTLGRIPLPRLLRAPLWRLYARRYGADLSEAAEPVETHRRFLDFFTRRLAEGRRPLPADPSVIVSPADGRVVASGDIEGGLLVQAKGITYSLADLLGSPADAERFLGGTFLNVYLAPGDYHRFHWPLDGTVHTIRHIPGDLWPVNAAAVAAIPGLLVKNERVALLGSTHTGADFAIVPVGALNVGSIRLTNFPLLRTNRAGPSPVRTFPHLSLRGVRGGDLGYFEFGSSIVLVLSPAAGRLDAIPPTTRVTAGIAVGKA